MKKFLFPILLLYVLVLSTYSFADNNYGEHEDKGIVTLNEIELMPLSEVPEGITPFVVNSIEELKAFYDKLDALASEQDMKIIDESNDSVLGQIYISESNNTNNNFLASSATPYYFSKITKIFDLNNIGGRVEQKVDYIKWYFNDSTGAGNYYITVDDYIAATNGMYGLQEITITKNEATVSSNGQSINCRVKGYTRVYVEVLGQGVSLKTYYFDKSYSIN